jgi:hypothetical protein
MFSSAFKLLGIVLWGAGVHCMESSPQMEYADVKIVQDHYQRYLTVSGQYATGMNVHKFNQSLNMRKVLTDLQKIDEQYIHSIKDYEPVYVIGAIKVSDEFESLRPSVQQSVKHNLKTLYSHLLKNPVENSETGVNVAELLSRVWYLSNFDEVRSNANIFRTGSAARYFLLEAIRENSETGGGCFAGFSGRLGSFYLMLINSWMIQ